MKLKTDLIIVKRAVVMRLLKLLELLANNCNKRFHMQLANKDFLQELKTMIGPKHTPPLVIQEKVLFLVQKWANMFRNDHDLKAVELFYFDLKSKGIEFPNASEEALIGETKLSLSPQRQQPATPKPQSLKNIVPGAAAAVRLNDEQMGKLKSELEIVDNNVLVMNEMLTEYQPQMDAKSSRSAQVLKEDVALLSELHRTTSEMQKRITQLIGNIANESIIGELLRINDDLNNVFLRYERFQKNLAPPSAMPTASGNQERNPKVAIDEKPLIDFNDELVGTDVNSKMNKMGIKDEDQFLHDENEIREMENWLKTQEGEKFQESNKGHEL